MNIKSESRIENKLNIFEEDIVNGGKILILTIYTIKENDGVWQFPSPQIFNEDIYNRYKDKYDAQIVAFRNDCENLTEEKGSVLANEIESLKQELSVTQNAINEILFGEV